MARQAGGAKGGGTNLVQITHRCEEHMECEEGRGARESSGRRLVKSSRVESSRVESSRVESNQIHSVDLLAVLVDGRACGGGLRCLCSSSGLLGGQGGWVCHVVLNCLGQVGPVLALGERRGGHAIVILTLRVGTLPQWWDAVVDGSSRVESSRVESSRVKESSEVK